MTDYRFIVERCNGVKLEISLKEGKPLFVLGANGVGKSALMHRLYTQNLPHTKRILAHRQTWFIDNTQSVTPTNKKSIDEQIKAYDQGSITRWRDDLTSARTNNSIYNLIDSINVRARAIANAVGLKNFDLAKSLSINQSQLEAINEIFNVSNIPIEISLSEGNQLLASKNGSDPYSIAELSDGERNALLICIDVLSTDPNNLIILDEPERHLHRSIISPLLNTLFQKRKDCAFVISTHDFSLPIDNCEASILLLRSCQWSNKQVNCWDMDLIDDINKITNDFKKEILGSKRKILFVEGGYTSLDVQLYSLIFPSITVLPKGNCTEVEKAVKGIKSTEGLHWINTYGLIDADNRTEEEINNLLSSGIIAINCYSVESLYYNLEIVRRIAKRLNGLHNQDENVLFENATSEIMSIFSDNKELLCSQLCEKQVRNKVMIELPTHKDIRSKSNFNYTINLKEFLEKEIKRFNELLEAKDLMTLISRYPIKKTCIMDKIAKGLGLKNTDDYEAAVRKLIIDDINTKDYFKQFLIQLTTLIEES